MGRRRIPRPKTWLRGSRSERETERKRRIRRRRDYEHEEEEYVEIDEDDEDDVDDVYYVSSRRGRVKVREKRGRRRERNLFSDSMGSVLSELFDDIDEEEGKLRWEDTMDIMGRSVAKAVAMGATLIISNGMVLGVQKGFEKAMRFRW